MFQVIKLISRITHMFSTAMLSGMVVLTYLFDVGTYFKDNQNYKKFHMISGIALILSGIFNIFLIKGGKKLKKEHKLWIHFFELKFVIALLMTPLINPILSLFAKTPKEVDALRTTVQFYLVIFMYIYSTLIKYFREDICNNFNDDKVLEKVQELQKKYETTKDTQPKNQKKQE